MQTILVTGGAGFIGSCFVRQCIGQRSARVVNLDKLDLRRQPRFAGSRCWPTRTTSSCRATWPTATRSSGSCRARADGRRALRRRIARRPLHRRPGANSSAPTSRGRFKCSMRPGSIGSGCRRTAARASAFSTSRPTRSTGRWGRRAGSPNRAPTTQLALLGVEGGGRPLRPRVLSHLRPAGAGDQLLEQLRPLPVPGKAAAR